MEDPASPNMMPVTSAIAGLPHLKSLQLRCSGLSHMTVEPLTALTLLTCLDMAGQDFDDSACISLVLSLTGLRQLSLQGSDGISNVSVLAISKALLQLTELNLEDCGRVTDRNVLQLSLLRGLRLLWAEHADVTPDAVPAVLRHTARLV